MKSEQRRKQKLLEIRNIKAALEEARERKFKN